MSVVPSYLPLIRELMVQTVITGLSPSYQDQYHGINNRPSYGVSLFDILLTISLGNKYTVAVYDI